MWRIRYFVFCYKYSRVYNFNSPSTAKTPITEDLVLTTAPTIHSTVSSIEVVTEPSDQTSEYKDESKVLF